MQKKSLSLRKEEHIYMNQILFFARILVFNLFFVYYFSMIEIMYTIYLRPYLTVCTALDIQEMIVLNLFLL